MRRPAMGLLLVLLALAATPSSATGDDGPAAAADPYEAILAAHRAKLKTDSVVRAIDAVRLLDPENPRSMPEYLGILARWHWRVRGAAIEALASIQGEALRAEMRLRLVTHEDPWVREGMAFAMTITPLRGDGEALVAAMDDKDWRVRRTAARGLGEIVSREGVERLVLAFEDEKDLRVRVWARASLRSIAGEDLGFDPRAWRAWWKRAKDLPEFKRHEDEVLRSEFKGVTLERITIDITVGSEEEKSARRKRPDLFVLAPFGWSHDWFRPYLDEAARFLRITYVTLPTVPEATGTTGYGASIPVYPVGKMAAALDALREASGKEQVLVLAAGPVGWIAETYAMRFKKHVAGLVIVDSWLDAQAYTEAVVRMARDGTPHERWAAQTLMGDGNRDAAEERELSSVHLTASLQDKRDSEAFRLWRSALRPHGFATVPDLLFDRHTKIHLPTLFYFPDPDVKPSSGGTADDLRRIRDSFKEPPPVPAVIRDGRGFTLQEDPQEFLRILQGYMEFAGILR